MGNNQSGGNRECQKSLKILRGQQTLTLFYDNDTATKKKAIRDVIEKCGVSPDNSKSDNSTSGLQIWTDHITNPWSNSVNGVVSILKIKGTNGEMDFLMKTPIQTTVENPGNDDDIYIEKLIHDELGDLRDVHQIPNFSYLLAYIECETEIERRRINGSKKSRIKSLNYPVCQRTPIGPRSSKSTHQYLLMELVNKPSLDELNNQGLLTNVGKETGALADIIQHPLTLEAHINLMVQILLALQEAQDHMKFTHYDLHAGNVLIQSMEIFNNPDAEEEVNNNKFLKYIIGEEIYYVKANMLAVIIDFGRSHIDKKITKKWSTSDRKKLKRDLELSWDGTKESYGINPSKFNSLYDTYFIIDTMFYAIYNHHKDKNRDILLEFYNWFDNIVEPYVKKCSNDQKYVVSSQSKIDKARPGKGLGRGLHPITFVKKLEQLGLYTNRLDNDSLIFNHGNNGTIHRTGSKSPIPRRVESEARNQSDGSNYISFVSTSKRHIARKIRDEDLAMSELQEEEDEDDEEEYDEENWVESKTEDGDWYFWNSETDESIWAINAWEKKVSRREAAGEVYYFNKLTGESTWDVPNGLSEEDDEDDEEDEYEDVEYEQCLTTKNKPYKRAADCKRYRSSDCQWIEDVGCVEK